MVKIPEIIRLRPVRQLDAENGWGNNEPKIRSDLKDAFAKLLFKPVYGPEELEYFDLKPGFNALERQIADQHIRIGRANRAVIENVGSRGKYDLFTDDVLLGHSYFSILNRFYARFVNENMKLAKEPGVSGQFDRWYGSINYLFSPDNASHPFTTDYIKGIMKTLSYGVVMAAKLGGVPDDEDFSPLWDNTRDYLLNAASAVFLRNAKWASVPPSSKPEELLLTEKDVIGEHLYGPIGYYEIGLDQKDRGESYQSQVNVLSPFYGRLMAWYIFDLYEKYLAEGKIEPYEKFTVYEHGGGDGRLARDILMFIRDMAAEGDEDDWKLLFNNMEYISVEIASSGVEKQMEVAAEFENFMVIQADATKWKPLEKSKGIVISVLLVDSFPPHLVYKEGGKTYAVYNIPTLTSPTREILEDMLQLLLPDESDRKTAREDSEKIKGEILRIGHDIYNHFYFSKRCFKLVESGLKRLREKNASEFEDVQKIFLKALAFLRVTADIRTQPEIPDFFIRHASLEATIPEEKDNYYINTDIDPYIELIAENYFSGGEFLTVDLYNELTVEIVERMGGTARPALTMQSGSVKLKLDHIDAVDFGGLLVYLGINWMTMKETLDRVSGGNGNQFRQEKLQSHFRGNIDSEFESVADNLLRNDPKFETHENAVDAARAAFYGPEMSVFTAPLGK